MIGAVPPRVLLDACVLFSASLRDLLLNLTVNGLFEAKWTDEIHEEWIENLPERDRKGNDPPRLDRAKLERTRNLMNLRAEGSLVQRNEHRIDALLLPDLDDRHVLAAAIESKSSAIITFNLKDFPESILSFYGVTPFHPDIFLCTLFDDNETRFLATLTEILARLSNPPRTLAQYNAKLRAIGLKDLAERLRAKEPESV